MLAATAFTACGEDDEPLEPAQPSTSLAPATTAPAPILLRDFSFSGLEVKAGAKVLVQNQGQQEHTLTAEDNRFDTGRVAPGSNVQFTVPSAAGTYKVRCTVHPSRMTGELKVT